jgi:hypothetical protein
VRQYEENRRISAGWGWAIIIVLCAAVLGWGYFRFRAVPDAPRHWDFGELPDAPGQSIYSTSQPTQTSPARQVPLPPEAATGNRDKTTNGDPPAKPGRNQDYMENQPAKGVGL